MNYKELLEDAKKNAPNNMVNEVIKDFEEFSDLYTQRLTFHPSNPDYQEFRVKLHESYQKLGLGIERMTASFGLTIQQLKDYIENPKNFSAIDWEKMQSAKQELSKELELPSKPVKKAKKAKIKNNQYKI